MGAKEEVSAQSPTNPPNSSASSAPKEQSEVELELRILEALETYPPSKLQGMHRHFVLYGLMECLQKRFDRQFSSDDVLQLLDRFFNLEMLEADEEDGENLKKENFSLPQRFFKEEDA